ncbi:Replication factor C subunit [Trichinella spiralis]|uniref:Replication factor C subunit n=2 Tax=Trichinella spiralis TaxID=6334 RepID=A0ABR3KLP2_TRISP
MKEEDVYETSDLPECEQHIKTEEVFESEHIDSISISPLAAYEVFKAKTLESDQAELGEYFRGYDHKLQVSEESIGEKYNRLRREVDELVKSISSAKESSQSANTAEVLNNEKLTFEEADALQHMLKKLQVEQVIGESSTSIANEQENRLMLITEAFENLKKMSPPKKDGKAVQSEEEIARNKITFDFYPNKEQQAFNDQARISQLESRIAQFETLLGVDKKNMQAVLSELNGKTFKEALDELKLQVEMLDTNHLDTIEARLSAICSKISVIKEKKPNLDSEQEKKIEELYDMMKKWDSTCDSLPLIVDRLQSLQVLHEQAVQFSQYLTYLDGVQQDISKSLSNCSTLLTEVQTVFGKNMEVIKENFEAQYFTEHSHPVFLDNLNLNLCGEMVDKCRTEILPWVEKYRPSKLEELISHKDILETIGRFINENRLPHLLFYGPPGTGKTSTILACAKQLYEKNQLKSMVLELNASDDRGIGVVREQILNFASTKTIFGGRFKMIILDEADAMTRDAQNALRRIIEKYTDNVRFCLICNYLSKIIPPLQSRCTRFRFAPLKSNQITPRLMHVIEAEKVKFTEEGLQHLVLLSGGDMRRALNILQSTAMAFDMVNMENVYACVGKPKPDDIKAIVEWLFNKDFSETYKRITFLKLKKGLALQDILEEVHLFVQKVEIPALVRIYLIDRLAEIEESLTRGASDKLQLSALIAAFHIARDIIEKEAIVVKES